MKTFCEFSYFFNTAMYYKLSTIANATASYDDKDSKSMLTKINLYKNKALYYDEISASLDGKPEFWDNFSYENVSTNLNFDKRLVN